MRLAIYLDEATHKAFRIKAIEEGTSATRLAERLLKAYLAKAKKGGT